MKKNRLLAITLSAALLLGLLAGCGNKNSNDKPGNPDNDGNKPANSSSQPPPSGFIPRPRRRYF